MPLTRIIPRDERRVDIVAAAGVQRPQRCGQYFKPSGYVGPARAESLTEFAAEIRNRYAHNFPAARSDQNTVFEQIRVGRVLRTLQAEVQNIGFVVEIKPQILGTDFSKMRRCFENFFDEGCRCQIVLRRS